MEIGYHIRLLGSVRVEVEAEPTRDFASRKSLALLSYLIRQEGPVSRGHLADLFWPDNSESRGRRNLSHELSLLSKKLPGCFQADYHTVQFQPTADYWMDTFAFEKLLKQSRRAALRQAQDSERRGGGDFTPGRLLLGTPAIDTEFWPEALAEAVELYRGDFMAGYYLNDCPEFESWLLREQELWRRQVTEALDRLIVHHIQNEQDQQAQVYATRWLALEPWREEAHRQLMLILARTGNRSAALAQYETCRRFLAEELVVEPTAETIALYEQIRVGELSRGADSEPKNPYEQKISDSEQENEGENLSTAPLYSRSPAPFHNLPAQTTPFVDREAELAQLANLLADPACRLVTILGAGGMGKTRLALEAAAAQLDRFSHGVYLVQLAPLQSVETLAPTLAQALNFSFYQDDDPWQQLLNYLRSKHMLLIMDNLEHLLTSVQEGAGIEVRLTNILNTAAQVKILVTSRAKLGVQGEYLLSLTGLEVPPLETPATLPGATRYSAIELFRQNARRVQLDFQLSIDNWTYVTQICRLIEGMPLGVVLATSWLDLLNPFEIVTQIQQSLDFLEIEGLDLPERQRSMRAIFDHSWRLLTAREQTVFQQISLFRGGFSAEAVQAVIGDCLPELRALVNKSLLRRLQSGRYEIHELLRQYGAEKLAGQTAEVSETSAVSAVHDRHSGYYCSFLQAREADLKGARQQLALSEIQEEHENIRLAWRWAAEQGQVERLAQAMDGLGFFYDWRGRFQEGEISFRIAAERLNPAIETLPILAKLLAWQALFCQTMGRTQQAHQLFQKSLSYLDNSQLTGQNSHPEKAFVLFQIGNSMIDIDRQEAKRLLEQSLKLYQTLRDRWATARALTSLGNVASHLIRYEESQQCLQESLAIQQELLDQRNIAKILTSLGYIARHQGRLEEAEQLQRQSLRLIEKMEDRAGLAGVHMALGTSLEWLGQFSDSIRHYEEGLAVYKDLGYHHAVIESNNSLASAKQHLGWYEQASAHAQMAFTLNENASNQPGIGFTFGYLGFLALVKGAYLEAQQRLQEGVVIFRRIKQQVANGFGLATLGGLACHTHNFQQAQQYLVEPLQIALETRAFFLLHVTLAFVALFLAKQGQAEQAVEIYTLASRFPYVGRSHWFEDVAGRHVAAAAVALPSEVVAAAQEQGRTRDLWATAEELLEKLKE
jgi:predicted ATPase/DNA-binding SARP family transcriptional activator